MKISTSCVRGWWRGIGRDAISLFLKSFVVFFLGVQGWELGLHPLQPEAASERSGTMAILFAAVTVGLILVVDAGARGSRQV